ncbi:MAG: acyl-CoA dehydrogenase [Deltaproteobacteria bacterium]|nr:acyl-CoA dehydrogenase [Deltaproteobacteria bacterium]
MTGLLVDERDQRFVLFEMLGVDELCNTELYGEHSIKMFDMVLDTAHKMAHKDIWPTYQEGDRLGGAKMVDGKAVVPECFKAPYEKFVKDGWLTLDVSFEHGGQQMPYSIATAAREVFMAANPAFVFLAYGAPAAGRMAQNYGDDRQRRLYMEPLYEGRYGGTMCLTEPDAGSDVGALRTSASPTEDDRYKIKGTKIFITNGDQDIHSNIIHPVLARIDGDPVGTKGISIFLVPKNRVNEDGTVGASNDVQTVNMEHKMGIKASPTCTLGFGENDDCIGELLGERCGGMKVIFQMINEARIIVGMQGVAHSSASYLHALSYAKERVQGTALDDFKDPSAPKVPIVRHPDVRRMLMTMKSYTEGMRALLYYTAYCLDRSDSAEGDDSANHHDRMEILTPILKAYCSDMGFRVCEIGMQILGGYGYCREFPMEQFLRDSKIGSIYEGANGIQAIDLLGRKLGMKGGQVLMTFLGEISELAKKHADGPFAPEAAILAKSREVLGEVAMHLMMAFQRGELAHTLLNAGAVLELMGDVTLGWLLLWQAGIAQDKLDVLFPDGEPAALEDACAQNADIAFYAGKVATARFFINRVLTLAPGKGEVIKNPDDSALTVPEVAM